MLLCTILTKWSLGIHRQASGGAQLMKNLAKACLVLIVFLCAGCAHRPTSETLFNADPGDTLFEGRVAFPDKTIILKIVKEEGKWWGRNPSLKATIGNESCRVVYADATLCVDTSFQADIICSKGELYRFRAPSAEQCASMKTGPSLTRIEPSTVEVIGSFGGRVGSYRPIWSVPVKLSTRFAQ